MGNRNTIELEYKNKIFKDYSNLTMFELTTNLLNQGCFKHRQPIVLKFKDENHKKFIGSDYTLKKLPPRNKYKFKIYKQLDRSIRKFEIRSKISKSMFKVLDFDQKILGTGVKISDDLCLIPKSFKLEVSYQEFCFNTTIELFDGTKGRLKADGVSIILGNSEIDQKFLLVEIEGNLERLDIKLYNDTSRINGNLICFNKKDQMLEAICLSNLKISRAKSCDLRENIQKFLLPGGVIVGDQGEILAIYVGGSAKTYFVFTYIFEQLSLVFAEYPDTNLRKKLAKIHNLTLKLSVFSSIFNNILDIELPSMKISNIYGDD